jgi:putative ABC transport system ATP-binding protein
MMTHKEIIRLEGVDKIYNPGLENEVVALKDVQLSVAEGEMICLQGPSGSGKTTLLSIIGCIFSPTRGRATIGGKKISRLPDHFLTSYRRQCIGFVFQTFQLLDYLTVLENVTLPLLPLGLSPKKREQKADLLLEKFDLGKRKKFKANTLSGGEMQRVALARALINDPPVIVADEPTAHLDGALAREIMLLFRSLKNEGKTVVISSHDPLVASHIDVDRCLEVRAGRVTAIHS